MSDRRNENMAERPFGRMMSRTGLYGRFRR
jgi:hypothetical protein